LGDNQVAKHGNIAVCPRFSSHFRDFRDNRKVIPVLPTAPYLHAFRVRGWALLALLSFALPARAWAGPVVLPDPMAAPDQAELAGGVSLLVRSYLRPGPNPMVPRRQLALAIEALTERPPGKNLGAAADLAPKLMERLGAEFFVAWEMQVAERGTKVRGMVLGAGGKRLLRLNAAAAAGDIAELARQLAKRIAPAIGAGEADMPEAGVAEVRPFVGAESALLAGDAVAASRAVELALPSVVSRLLAAKEILRAVAEDTGLPALPRAQAWLLMGDFVAASELADRGLATDARNLPLRAVKVRALASLKEFGAAQRELLTCKDSRNFTLVALAALTLALERGDPVEKRDQAVAMLVGRPAAEWRPLLPLIATTPPGSFGPRVEAAVLAAAAKFAPHEPSLANMLAARALAGGAGAEQTASLVNLHDLSAEQIQAISARLNAEADSASADLHQRIKERQAEAKEIAAAAGPEKPTGPPSTLARNLLPVLQGFEGLYEPRLTTIQIAPLPGSGQPFYWPFLVRRTRLVEGLLETLMRSPWELQAKEAKIATDTLPPDRLTEEGMATLANDLGTSALLFYRIRPAGLAPWVDVDMVLHDGIHQRTDRARTSLIGRSTGLVIINPLVIALGILAFLAALGWAVVISLRGTILVRVQWDSDAKDELFSILISRSPLTPTIDNITVYRKKLEWLGKRKRRFEAWNIDQNTTFRRIPRGQWYVHLYGIYTRGRQTMVLHEPPQEAEVLPRKTTFVAHVLEAAEAEFKLTIVDDRGPVEGARVWLDDQRAKAIASDKDGHAALKVAKGFHVIHVAAKGMEMDRPYHVVKAKVHEMTINLVWERRQEYVSRALERQVDDAAEYMTRPPRGTGPAVAARSATGMPRTTPSSIEGPGLAAPPAPHDGVGDIEIDLGNSPVADSPVLDLRPAPQEEVVSAAAPPAAAPVAPPPAPRPAASTSPFRLRPLSHERRPTPVPPPELIALARSGDVPVESPPRRSSASPLPRDPARGRSR